jgi:hypothetical protein
MISLFSWILFFSYMILVFMIYIFVMNVYTSSDDFDFFYLNFFAKLYRIYRYFCFYFINSRCDFFLYTIFFIFLHEYCPICLNNRITINFIYPFVDLFFEDFFFDLVFKIDESSLCIDYYYYLILFFFLYIIIIIIIYKNSIIRFDFFKNYKFFLYLYLSSFIFYLFIFILNKYFTNSFFTIDPFFLI